MDKNISIKSQIITYETTSCMDEYIEEDVHLLASHDASIDSKGECGKCLYHEAARYDWEFGFLCEKCSEHFCKTLRIPGSKSWQKHQETLQNSMSFIGLEYPESLEYSGTEDEY